MTDAEKPSDDKPSKPGAPSEREARLAEALRANLRRRKAPRGVAPDSEAPDEGEAGESGEETPQD